MKEAIEEEKIEAIRADIDNVPLITVRNELQIFELGGYTCRCTLQKSRVVWRKDKILSRMREVRRQK